MRFEFEKKIVALATTKDADLSRLRKELEAAQAALPAGKFRASAGGKSGSMEDRVRSLLGDLEQQSRKHIAEIQRLHDHYQPYVLRASELEEKIKVLQQDAEHALENERIVRREL